MYAQEFTKAVEEGYGKKMDDIPDYSTPDTEMFVNLIHDAYEFSAAKNFTTQRQLTQALIGDDGKIRTYSQFKKVAFQIVNTHVKQWLNAEYDLAVASSQMASKWVDIINNPATKTLEFDAVLDGRTTEGCRSLNGVRKPVNDIFWNTYYPPNHFNCRSTVRQHSDRNITPNHAIVYPDDKSVPPIFRNNIPKQGFIHPKGSSYYIGLPADVKKDGERVFTKRIREWGKKNLAGQTIIANHIGEVAFTNSGIKEIINQPHALAIRKTISVFKLKQMVEEAKFIKSSPDVKGNQMIKAWHYLETEIAGQKSYIVVREMASGEKTVYSIVDHLK